MKGNDFFLINDDKSAERLKSLKNKHVVLEVESNNELKTIPGKLLDVFHTMVYVKEYDDGKGNNKSDSSFVNDSLEDIKISSIRGIEEMKNKNDLNSRYLNQNCEITNVYGKKINAYITGYDGFNIECEIDHEHGCYPYCLVESICMIK